MLEVCCREDQKVTCPHFWLGFNSEMLLTFCNDRSECFILHVGAHFRWIWLGEILTDSIWWWGLQCYCMLFYHMHITRQNVSHILAQDSKRSLRKMFSFSKVMIKQFCDQTASALLANLPETTGSQLWDKRAIIEQIFTGTQSCYFMFWQKSLKKVVLWFICHSMLFSRHSLNWRSTIRIHQAHIKTHLNQQWLKIHHVLDIQ